MGRKNYLVEELTKEEKLYLKLIILTARKRYIRDNYYEINSTHINFDKLEDYEAESVLDSVIDKFENEAKSIIEFENTISNTRLYNAIKALSLKEKMVLFYIYKENKTLNQTALEMKMGRTTLWRVKNNALDKIMNIIIGGGKNV